MKTSVVVYAICALFITAAITDGAFAQSPPQETAKPRPGERQGDQIAASPHTRRLYECRALARAHNFGFHFIRKGEFMRACLAQKT
jgi:hypothetical protein